MNEKAKCPIAECNELLIYHDVFGAPSNDPIQPVILKNVYECPTHGFFAYEGDGLFQLIDMDDESAK